MPARPTLPKPRPRASQAAALLFFILFLAVGLWIYRDFGVSWDEPVQVTLGIQNYNYALHGSPQLLANKDRYYGPLFEMLLVRLQNNSGDPRDLYLSRHLLNFLCFYAGCVGFYFLARRIFHSSWTALIGVVFLVVSPRIFSNAFYDSKDIPFLVFYIFGLLSLIGFLDRPTPLRALLHAGVTAAVIAIRLPGLILPALTLLGLACEALAGRVRVRRTALLFLLHLASAAALVLLFWPALWHAPLDGIRQAFALMSHYPLQTAMRYLGGTIDSAHLPRHYIPVWIGVTTPLSYLVLFTAGLALLLRPWLGLTRARLSPERRNDALILAALLGPLAVVIALRSVLYDAWRQMYFIYPPLLLVALYAVAWGQNALARRPLRPAVLGLAALLAVDVLATAGWMAANHPNEQVYFNRLAGPDMRAAQQAFMVDYWGLSYRQGLEYIARTDPAPLIPVYVETSPGRSNLALLPTQDALRIQIVSDFRQAKYYIGNYYLKPDAYPLKDEVFSVRVGDAKILSVFRLLPSDVD